MQRPKRKPPLARIYRGIVILPADFNASGIRWTASMHDGLPLRAETLRDIQDAIRERIKNPIR